MRFKTTGGADVTDDVRQALQRIVRVCSACAGMSMWLTPALASTQAPDLSTLLAQTEARGRCGRATASAAR